ncbi:hypothetical protein ATANTOWER_015044 [Ataeniobius toweri]|uniref:Uncharacterized protein n=1 Tax=Ataeniobius toweri TaxID=208326 RepID=A0ABU7AG30_9TELE|nr:hypothetical protein [Ataeniobius toweri]
MYVQSLQFFYYQISQAWLDDTEKSKPNGMKENVDGDQEKRTEWRDSRGWEENITRNGEQDGEQEKMLNAEQQRRSGGLVVPCLNLLIAVI